MSVMSRWEAYYERQRDLAAEAPEFERSETRRARKPYTCFYCRRPIAIGQRYHRTFTIEDGKADATKQCISCARGYDDETI